MFRIINFFRSLSVRQIILIAILLIATTLRFWDLGGIPPSASMDEASIGYNAYSVLKTGVDEYGKFPIVSQRGYDDWRRSTYLFLVVPSVGLFGLSDFSVRLPSAILSVLTVLSTYYIVKLLFSKQDHFSLNVALIASFLLAINPWHIYISRLGHESNAYLSFFIFGVLFFLKGEREKSFLKIIFSAMFFFITIVSYYSGQAFIPLFILGLFFIFRRNLFSLILRDKKTIVTTSLLIILFIYIFGLVFSKESLIRFQGTSIFNPGATWQTSHVREQFYQNALKENNLIERVIYSKKIYDLQLFAKGYFSHFNPKWLFFNSGSEPFKIPGLGLLYLWEFPLIVIGMISLILVKQEFNKKLIIFWVLISPFPASVATGAPHAMRTYAFLPTWQILSALGIAYLYLFLKRINIQKGLIALLGITIILTIVFLINQYFIIFPKQQSSVYQYGMAKTIPYILKNEKFYNNIVFSNKENLYQSYMLFLYYSKYDPKLYQKEGGTISGGFSQSHKIGKYEFRTINYAKEKEGTLLVGNITDFPKGIYSLLTITSLDGKDDIKILER